MKDVFEIASGSVRGRDHQHAGMNCQDAFSYTISRQALVAVVCDGCGSGRHSEVGAKLGAKIVQSALIKFADLFDRRPASEVLVVVKNEILAQLATLAPALGPDLATTIHDYFLFTVVGTIMTPTTTSVFTFGDGVVAINNKAEVLEYKDNQPPYLAYALLDFELTRSHFEVHYDGPTQKINSLVLGTDGVSDLINAASVEVPGRAETVGTLQELLGTSKYFANRFLLDRRLTLLNREVIKPDWATRTLTRQTGLLPDDTTLVVIRRKHLECANYLAC